MSTTYTETHFKRDNKGQIRQQMKLDLELLISDYNKKEIGMRLISEKMGIGEKTLKRILLESSDPHFNTLIRFYHYFEKIKGINVEQNETHLHIKSLIEKENLDKNKKVSVELEDLLRNDKVFREIYLYSRAGHITKHWVKTEFGRYGLEMVDLMLKKDVLFEVDKNIYIEGPMTPSKGPDTLKAIISDLVKDHLRSDSLSELNQNSAFYGVEGLNEEAYLKLLTVIEEFKVNAAEIILDKSNKGDKRVFLTMVCDLLKDSEAFAPRSLN